MKGGREGGREEKNEIKERRKKNAHNEPFPQHMSSEWPNQNSTLTSAPSAAWHRR